MIGNMCLDLAFGCIPILGDAFDLAWKANRRNAILIDAFIEGRSARPVFS
jgi:hypothetical protein